MVTNFDSKIISIKCAAEHSLFLSYDGKVYSVGNNDKGQLGISDKKKKVCYKIEPILKFGNNEYYQATMIECTRWTSFVIVDGNVYTFGSNEMGLLTIRNRTNGLTEKRYSPIMIESRYFYNRSVIKISCGICHAVVLNDYNNCYVWGHSLSMGIGWERGIHPNPTEILRKIKNISCGDYHTLCQTFNDGVYIFGKNQGQKFFGIKEEKILKPKLIEKHDIIDKYNKNIPIWIKYQNIDDYKIHFYGATKRVIVAIE